MAILIAKVQWYFEETKKNKEKVEKYAKAAFRALNLSGVCRIDFLIDKKNDKVMDNRIKMAEEIINDTPKAVKRIKKDKGLIERTESSKTILTEDNKELLKD